MAHTFGLPQPSRPAAPTVAEFFAGIGLVAKALEALGFQVLWANDIEPAKHALYAANHNSAQRFLLGDIREVTGGDLPAGLDLATASFPCIDLSLAGKRGGLGGTHSGMFWEFARILGELAPACRPRAVLLENVHGFATSRGGQDVREALVRLNELGYSCDVLSIDGRHFVPQSRPRMFVVGLRDTTGVPAGPSPTRPGLPTDTRPAWLRRAIAANADLRLHEYDLPALPVGPTDLAAIVQPVKPSDLRWWTPAQVAVFLASLSPLQSQRVSELRTGHRTSWRTAYRRTRKGVAIWEVRRDTIAGCLRTTGGGSSRQALVELGRGDVRVRWMTPLEYARLMGAGDYQLRAGSVNQALFGFGDAVVVDVVRWLGEHYLLPVLAERATVGTGS